ncbi:unnamed protein product [Acanthoscelides obtectus]|uniref:Uncharacterized protein n=1 Tax=Acanthoscelides obtectus TaxID=200917 RepID=A0A9P0KPJ6_ACAOB|nr:unnamed protein product [Acanthoscelides obtectus]CAK1685438.1 hypothetical protein AOBTE_LOCUS35398 [Acanthoscelides obtectus]
MTRTLSGENYVTASLIIPLTKGLIRMLDDIDRSALKYEVQEFLDNIKQSAIDRLLQYEQRSVAKGATLMNPHFKKKGFVSENRAEDARIQIEAEVKTEVQRMPPPTQQGGNLTPAPYAGVLSYLNDQGERHSTASTCTVDATILVRQYVEVQPINNQRDPIKSLQVESDVVTDLAHSLQFRV